MDSTSSEADASVSYECDVQISRLKILQLIGHNLFDNASSMFEILEQYMSEQQQQKYNLPTRLKPVLRKLLFELQERKRKASYNDQWFLEKNKTWLSKTINFNTESEVKSKNVGAGRPELDFSVSSERTKRRKTEQLRTSTSPEELAYATQMNLRRAGKVDASAVLRDIVFGTPTKASKYRHCITLAKGGVHSPDKALSLFLENDMSTRDYQNLRNAALEENNKLYPSYRRILQVKKLCYPANITVTPQTAEVKLQELLDHTALRILQHQAEVVSSLSPEESAKLALLCKWGCDGSSGQSIYKQVFADEDGTQFYDSSILFTSLVPLKLMVANATIGKEKIIWMNPRPSSPRYCRPIRIQFIHETPEIALREVEYISGQIASLNSLDVCVGGRQSEVTYKLALTMIDGKLCNACTETASNQRCYLCGETSKSFNKIDLVRRKPITETNLQYGLSTLHAWIKCFECCLHIAYRLDVKLWRVPSNKPELKASLEERKISIQKQFREKTGLIVDMPKQNHGSSNDGNTARRFFSDSEVSASITGIDVNFIRRMFIILQAISCGHSIDAEKFRKYSLETAELYVKLYPWYHMPTTTHKLLIHGADIIGQSLLPIGQMSEEAQESCNKYFKRYRENAARKCSRQKNLEDILLRMLARSDPYITSIRKLKGKPRRSLKAETVALLLPPEINREPTLRGEIVDGTPEEETNSDSDSEEYYSDDE